jgi:phosphoribosylformylglycinamidine cyclo-ligase
MDRHDTIGQDLVNHCVNDIAVLGAEPLFFLDYLGTGKLEPHVFTEIIKGFALACAQNRCALVGGETAQMPGFYQPGEYDLAGFAVGAAERGGLIDGSGIRPGDALIGLPSSGLHSNGYSLARAIVESRWGRAAWRRRLPEDGRSIGEAFLAPTRIYVKPVLGLLRRYAVGGIVHLTGGGWTENIPRVLPRGCAAAVDLGSWPVPPLFTLLEREGRVGRDEMLRTFNLGIGMILVARPPVAEDLMRALRRRGEVCHVVGTVVKGGRRVLYRERAASGARGRSKP